MPLPRFLPFPVFRGLVQVVDAQDLDALDLDGFKREVRPIYREIDQTVRCITPGEDQGLPANCQTSDLEGERKFFQLVRESNGERIGGLILNAVHVELEDRRRIRFFALPTPAMGDAGADIWGRTNSPKWLTAVPVLLRDLLDADITSDKGQVIEIVGWLFPPRIQQHVGEDWKALSDLTRTSEQVDEKTRIVLRRAGS